MMGCYDENAFKIKLWIQKLLFFYFTCSPELFILHIFLVIILGFIYCQKTQIYKKTSGKAHFTGKSRYFKVYFLRLKKMCIFLNKIYFFTVYF